jgi:putative nucleotidyltransferase with HDIG domain
MIAERIFGQNGEDAFLCGILHDIGMIVEDQVAQDLFVEACRAYQPNCRPITDYEREHIGSDHCVIGYLLAREWKLPIEVQQGIKHHHKTLNDVFPSSITGIIHIAEYIAAKLNYKAIPQMNVILSPSMADHIRDNIGEYKTLIKDLPEAISKARDLYESKEE